MDFAALLRLNLLLGVAFGLLGSASAYLITYNEWRRHYTDDRPAHAHAIRAAGLAFVVFVVISVFAAVLVKFLVA